MNALKLLNEYIDQHPDYWNYQNEVKEVQKLKRACLYEALSMKKSQRQTSPSV